MTPTREQIEQVAAAAWEGSGIYSGYHSFWNDPAQRAIHKWEEIRPKEDQSQLQRTNHALAAEMADVKTELNARLHERTQAFLAKETALAHRLDAALAEMTTLGASFNRRGTELLEAKREISRLTALLPAPAPKPTAEELERAEFMTAILTKYPEFDGATDFAEGALEGWKAARAAKGGSEA